MSRQKCCVFIDNSNLFIEGQKFFARHKGLRTVVTQDIRFRIDIGRLVEELSLARGREKIYAKLYGSEPPPNDSLWQEIRNKGIQVNTFQRNSEDYEKELDTSLTADVTEQACDLRDPPGSVTFIIIGGDRDYLPSYEKVLKRGWKLEVVAWKNCLSQKVSNYVKANEIKGVKLILLDDLAITKPDLYFLADKWTAHKPLPRDRTIVFEYENGLADERKAKKLNTDVTDLIKLPCWYLCRPENDPKIVMIVIIPNQDEGKYSTGNLFEDIRSRFATKCKRIVDFVTFKQEQNPLWSEDFLLNYKYFEEEEEKESSMQRTPTGGQRGGDFKVVEAKQRKSKQKFSVQCIYRYACRLGKDCLYAHTYEEKAHFKAYPWKLGKLYKAKYCSGVDNNKCQHLSSSKLCTYAHDICEARCYNCDPGGLEGQHWMDQCPKKMS